MISFRSACSVLVLAVCLSACGGSSGDDQAGGGSSNGGSGGTIVAGGGAGGNGTGGNDAGAGGGPECAPGPGHTSTDPAHLVKTFVGSVIDLDGNPAKQMLATVCGVDICIYGSTDDQGKVVTCDKQTNVCATGINPNQEIRRPAFKYGDGLGYAKFAQLLPTDTSDYDVGVVTTAALPPMSAGTAIVAGGDASVNGITLSVAAGATVKIDKLTFETEESWRFRAVEIPLAKSPPAVDPSLGFEIVVATTPIDTQFCPHAKLSVPNTPGWPSGSEVEIWMHGVSPDEEWAQYASWAKVSGGRVSADGKNVVSNDGEGVPLLSVFGIKKK